MTDVVALGLALAGGAALGVFYFGTLWLVVRRLDRVPRPGLWLMATGAVRLGAVLLVIGLLAGTRWEHLFALMAGFLAARVVLTRRLGVIRERQ